MLTQDFEGLAHARGPSVENGARRPLVAASESIGRKYGAAGSHLLRSSASLGWKSSAIAEVFRHFELSCKSFVQPVTEIVINLSGTARFRRKADGPEQRFFSSSGSLSICPNGVSVKYLNVDSGPLDMLHLYMPTDLFGALKCSVSEPDSALIYTGGLYDPLIQGIGFAIAEELMHEGADEPASHLILDSFSVALAARLLQRYARRNRREFTESYFDAQSGKGLDATRLKRVVDFIHSNIGSNLTLDELSEIACLSAFHFSRSFKTATGVSPFKYVLDVRIDRAKQLLANRRTSVDDVAMSTGFSSGANLARAFKKAVGTSPSRWRLIRST